jgi:hypothetical protein
MRLPFEPATSLLEMHPSTPPTCVKDSLKKEKKKCVSLQRMETHRVASYFPVQMHPPPCSEPLEAIVRWHQWILSLTHIRFTWWGQGRVFIPYLRLDAPLTKVHSSCLAALSYPSPLCPMPKVLRTRVTPCDFPVSYHTPQAPFRKRSSNCPSWASHLLSARPLTDATAIYKKGQGRTPGMNLGRFPAPY